MRDSPIEADGGMALYDGRHIKRSTKIIIGQSFQGRD